MIMNTCGRKTNKMKHCGRGLSDDVRSDKTGQKSCSRLLQIAFAFSAIVFPFQAYAQDLFIGMVVEDGSGLVLERCQAGKTRFRLQAAEGTDDPLEEIRGKKGLVQARIYGHYRAEGDGHALDVLGVDGVQFGKTCHLVEAIEAYMSEIAQAASTEEAERWKALRAGAAAAVGTEVVGTGDYAYRFVLLHPRTGKPAPDTDYALSASRATDYALPFVTDEKKVYQGRTDGQGQTPVFRLPVRLPDEAFDLRERFGSGPFGETFHLADHHDNDLFNMPYLLMTCTTPPRFFRGYTYPNGDTAYAASDGPINIRLLVLGEIGETLPTSCEDETSNDDDHTKLPTSSVSKDN
jgi:hypothetical protein